MSIIKKLPAILLLAPALCLLAVLRAEDAAVIEVATADSSLVLVTTGTNAPVVLRHYGSKTTDTRALLAKTVRQNQVYPAFGGVEHANLALNVIHADGSLTTELVYDGHEQRALDADRQETVVRLRDKQYPFFVELRLVAHKAANVITQRVTVSHKEPGPVRVENIASAYLPLRAGAYWLTHFHGAWGREMRVTEERLTSGGKVIEEFRKIVQATMADNPSFMLSLEHAAEEESGEVYAGTLAWSGNYKLAFTLDERETLHITAGMNPFAATRILDAGASLETPEMVLTYSARGRGQASRNLHDWARKYALYHGDQLRPILLNSWEGAYFKFDEKTLTDMMDDTAAFGIEMFVLDDGWFGNGKYARDSARAGLGDWQVNKKKLPRGIGYLADYAVSKGLRFGIWIEPEMVNPKSELAKKHPEWIVKSPGRDIPQSRNQWLLDLSNPAVQDFVAKVFDDTVALSPNITYIKWDANRPVYSVGSAWLPADRQEHFWKDYVDGLYKVYERVRAKHPHITIQLCSSGGGRVDYGALKYHDEFWASDNTNAVDRVLIQYGTNMIYPPIATGSHVSASPNHQTDMMIPLKFRFDVAMSGRLGMELQPKDLAGADRDFARKAIENYKLIRPVVQFGDLYRLYSPYNENGRAAIQYVAKDKKQAVLFAYNLYHLTSRGFSFDIKLRGLDPAKTYKVTEMNREPDRGTFANDGQLYTGEFLMNVGVSIQDSRSHKNLRPQKSSVLWLVEQ